MENKSFLANQRGSALIGTLLIVIVLAFVAVSVVGVVINDTARNRQQLTHSQAYYVANGALDRFLARAQQTPALYYAPPLDISAGTIGEGTYTVVAEEIDHGLVKVTATGSVGNIAHTMKAYVRVGTWDSDSGFDQAIFSETDIAIGGDVLVDTGGIHSNQDVTLNGNAVQIGGDLSASGLATVRHDTVEGTVESDADRILFPELDVEKYTDIAVANGEVYTPAKDQAYRLSGTYTPVGGVMWVQGSVSINKETVVNGCIIAEGDINITAGNLVQNARPDVGITLPGVVSLYGDIKVAGHAEVNGLLYASAGAISVGGTMLVHGAIYSWGGISGLGNPTVLFNPDDLLLDAVDDPLKWRAKLLAMER